MDGQSMADALKSAEKRERLLTERVADLEAKLAWLEDCGANDKVRDHCINEDYREEVNGATCRQHLQTRRDYYSQRWGEFYEKFAKSESDNSDLRSRLARSVCGTCKGQRCRCPSMGEDSFHPDDCVPDSCPTCGGRGKL